MSVGILSDLHIAECGAFIAGPFSTMSLAELGAEVIRIDPLEGGLDYRRWPVANSGHSLYWAGLNKGKKSVAIDIASAEGRELAQAIIAAPGDSRGLFVTNLPAIGWLDYEVLRGLRDDLIMINIVGNRDGSTAIDYTVNCALGFPDVTGPMDNFRPVNHVLPAWDFICGQTAATALLAAERHRARGGGGQKIKIALADIAMAIVADMGLVAEVQINGKGRERCGNHIYGAFGRDFVTRDGRRLMVAAVSVGQWKALCNATGIGAAVEEMENRAGIDLGRDTDRFEARTAIDALLEPWFGDRTMEQARQVLDAHRVCWGPYQSFEQLVETDRRCSVENTMFADVDHPGIGLTLTPTSPIDFGGCDPVPPQTSPRLGQHTDQVLCELLGLGSGEIARLHDRRVIASASI